MLEIDENNQNIEPESVVLRNIGNQIDIQPTQKLIQQSDDIIN